MKSSRFDYISAGGNRHHGAADWDQDSGLLAFGADQNVALWKPLGAAGRGISDILVGLSDEVTAVKFGEKLVGPNECLFGGSTGGELCVWQSHATGGSLQKWKLHQRLKAHEAAVNSITTLKDRQLFASAGADSIVKLWRLHGRDGEVNLVYVIPLKPRYIPISIVVGDFRGHDEGEALFVAVGGTSSVIQIYVVAGINPGGDKAVHSLQATLTGHEGWITSLALRSAGGHQNDSNDVFSLASASQDKSIRIWHIWREEGQIDPISLSKQKPLLEQSLSAKTYRIRMPSVTFAVTFEALLLGHDDWIYTTSWNPRLNSRQLLSASADNSLIIWEPETSSSIWVNSTRLGEISSQKGGTSATGSTGGFWMGLWAPDGNAVTSLGKTGGWRLWRRDNDRSYWIQTSGLTGHTKAVVDLSWTEGGEYLLSTSSDQTTRLHAEWQLEEARSWHEFARPQIHGYDLNCVQSLGSTRFVSGADEKLLRVFEQPKNVAQMLERLCKIGSVDQLQSMPEAANMPALGLSNKAITGDSNTTAKGNDIEGADTESILGPISYDFTEPPSEDYLARYTLWPEREKLYGHGHEISALAANSSGTVIATACKASSTEHAVIRLYETKSWHEIRPPLTAHSLTIASTKFDIATDLLLSGGRDRQWSLFTPSADVSTGNLENSQPSHYMLQAANRKGHSRMILDVAWSAAALRRPAPAANGDKANVIPHSSPSPSSSSIPQSPSPPSSFFATASRDKTIKIWTAKTPRSEDDKENSFTCHLTLTRSSAVTSIDFHTNYPSRWGQNQRNTIRCLAAGEENGTISCHLLSVVMGVAPDHAADPSSASLSPAASRDEDGLRVQLLQSVDIDAYLCPWKAVTRVAWRPGRRECSRSRSRARSKSGSVSVARWDEGGVEEEGVPKGEDQHRNGAQEEEDEEEEKGEGYMQLAVASVDSSLRLLRIDLGDGRDLDEGRGEGGGGGERSE